MITILIVDDHAEFRAALRDLLAAEPDMEVVGEAGDADTALGMATDLQPDVVLMDVVMRGPDGIRATSRFATALPSCRVLGLSIHDGERLVAALLAAGARGFVAKRSAAIELATALRAVAAGGTWGAARRR